MSNFMRKFKRANARQTAYERRRQDELRRQIKIRKDKAILTMQDIWKEAVKAHVPEWIRNVGLRIVPMWYIRLIKWVLDKILTQEWLDSVIFKGRAQVWPKWRVNFNIYLAMWFKVAAGKVLLGFPMWVRGLIVAFGITTRIFESRQNTLKIQIFYLFKKVAEKEVTF